MTCPNRATFRLLTIVRGSSRGPTRNFIFAPHPVVGLVLQVEDAEKFLQALGLESLGPFLKVSKQCRRLIAIEEAEGAESLVQHELV